jgi:hypothetical protein
MDDETLNLSIRKFLKTVGVNSQREIEHAVQRALATGSLTGSETFAATMILDVPALKLNVKFEGDITLN